jgi:hypothetical protein
LGLHLGTKHFVNSTCDFCARTDIKEVTASEVEVFTVATGIIPLPPGWVTARYTEIHGKDYGTVPTHYFCSTACRKSFFEEIIAEKFAKYL